MLLSLVEPQKLADDRAAGQQESKSAGRPQRSDGQQFGDAERNVHVDGTQ